MKQSTAGPSPRRHVFRTAAVVVSAAVAGAAVLWSTGWNPPRRAIGAALEAPVRLLRRLRGNDLSPFTHLAASQLGFAPAAPKAFTSPTPFTGFTIVDEKSGEVAWRGGGPARELPTTLLGPVTRVWIGEFTPLATPGRYHIVADNGLSSHPFDIGPDVFDDAIRAVQRAFYFQRAFTAVTSKHAEGPWIHDSDESLAPPGVRGGWHDAGDYSVYNMTTVTSLFWLLEAHSDFAPSRDDTNIPESGNGVPDLLDEARWGLDWLLSVQDDQGGFHHSTCLATYRAYGDNPIDGTDRYADGEVGTMATARAVGILAYASTIYGRFDPAFAARMRDAADRGWQYLEARPLEHSDGPTCGNYRQDGEPRFGRAVRAFAAAGMLAATGSRAYHDAFESQFDGVDGDPSAFRFNGYAGLLYLRAPAGDDTRKATIRTQLEAFGNEALADGRSHPFEWTGRYFWGSIGAGFERSGGFHIKRCLADPEGAAPHCRQAIANVDYTFGRNVYQFAYVSGVPGVTNGRRHSFHHWLATLQASPYLFPGAVAGGPNEHPERLDGSRALGRPIAAWGYFDDPAMPRSVDSAIDGRFTDNDSWSTNETAVSWQAVTLYSLYFNQWASAHWADSAAP